MSAKTLMAPSVKLATIFQRLFMCGINLIISSKDASNQLKLMNQTIAHRGPDGEGSYQDHLVYLGHRRLAILDLSLEGHQPMINDNLVISFNGEIYNYIELRNELIELGHIFKSKTDTEVILKSFKQWGPNCFERFNGMWGLILYDKADQKIIISRDRFGVKPVYYTKKGNDFLVSSEIKPLLTSENLSANQNILMDYLIAGFVDHTEETFFTGIKKLLPSCYMVYDLKNHELQIQRYFQLKVVANSFNNFSNLFIDSVKLRLRSDVEVGTCLSGGLDSSAIASLASQHHPHFKGFHAQSIMKEFDESQFAHSVSEKCKIDLKVITPKAVDFKNELEEIIKTQEEPFISPSIAMQYFVMKKANLEKIKVLLDGQGGDETLLGYEKYYPCAFFTIFYQSPKHAFSFIRFIFKNNHRFNAKSFFKYFIGMKFPLIRYLLSVYQLKNSKLLSFYSSYFHMKKLNTDSLFELQKVDIESLNLPALLRFEDKNSMRFSIETRLPFLDYRLVEHNLNLKLEEKIHEGWSKITLRRFLDQRLPDDLVWRKHKLGFQGPDKEWLEPLKEEMKNTISSCPILNLFFSSKQLSHLKFNQQIIWRLYNIALWAKVFSINKVKK